MTAEEFINNITHEIFKEAYDYYFKALPTPIVGMISLGWIVRSCTIV